MVVSGRSRSAEPMGERGPRRLIPLLGSSVLCSVGGCNACQPMMDAVAGFPPFHAVLLSESKSVCDPKILPEVVMGGPSRRPSSTACNCCWRGHSLSRGRSRTRSSAVEVAGPCGCLFFLLFFFLECSVGFCWCAYHRRRQLARACVEGFLVCTRALGLLRNRRSFGGGPGCESLCCGTQGNRRCVPCVLCRYVVSLRKLRGSKRRAFGLLGNPTRL